MNILINAVRSNWNSFNKTDRFLLSKVFETIEYHANNKEDIVIKFKKD